MPAAPFVVGTPVTAGSGATGGATTSTITIPTCQAGDFGVLFLCQTGTVAVNSVADAGGAVWSPGSINPLANGTTLNADFWTAPLTAANSGQTLTVTFASAQKSQLAVMVVRGSANRVDAVVTSQKTTGTTGTALTGPVVTPVGHNSLLVAAFMVRTFTAAAVMSVTPPGGWTEQTDGSNSAATQNDGLEVCTLALSGQAGVAQTAPGATADVAGAQYTILLLAIPPQDLPPAQFRRPTKALKSVRSRFTSAPVAPVVVAVSPPLSVVHRPVKAVKPVRARAAQPMPTTVAQAAAIPAQPQPRRRLVQKATRSKPAAQPMPTTVAVTAVTPVQPQPRRRLVQLPRRRRTVRAGLPVNPAVLLSPVLRTRVKRLMVRRSRAMGVPPAPTALAVVLAPAPKLLRKVRALLPRRSRTTSAPITFQVVVIPGAPPVVFTFTPFPNDIQVRPTTPNWAATATHDQWQAWAAHDNWTITPTRDTDPTRPT